MAQTRSGLMGLRVVREEERGERGAEDQLELEQPVLQLGVAVTALDVRAHDVEHARGERERDVEVVEHGRQQLSQSLTSYSRLFHFSGSTELPPSRERPRDFSSHERLSNTHPYTRTAQYPILSS